MRPAQLLLRPHWESGSGTAMLLRGRCVPGLGASPPHSPSTMFRLLVALRPALCARSLCLPPCACPCAAVPRAPYSLSPSAAPSPVRVGTFVSTGAVPVRRAACAAAAWRGPWRARGREGARAFGCTEARGDALPAEAVSTRVPGRRMKKKVALWLGYVGTRYKGLQIQRGPGSSPTIEEELEHAIFKAGGIIESNFRHLAKISWTRSSRTDKGVHSLCTVISMKMEVPEMAWVNDLDGFALADSINSHLSPFIRIFGIVPVSRSFRARHDCCTRSYNYLLPAAILGIHPDIDPSEVEQRVTRFQSLLHLFEGKHAYHNYTIRRLYRPFPQKPYKSRPHDRSDNCTNNDKYDKVSVVNNGVELEFLDEDFAEELSDVLEGELADEMVNTFGEGIQREENVPQMSTVALPGVDVFDRRAWWLPTPDGSDKVWSSHFRKVLSCTCSMPETFEEAQFIRISVTGSSFMVHQIRKMIGTAIAVFHELLPRDIIPISLARHSRIILPLAPPDGLILARSEFMPFRLPPIYQKKSDIKSRRSPVLRTQEKHPKLEMGSKVLHKVEEFCKNVLMPDILPLISAKTPNWSAWMMNLERNMKIPEAEMAEVRAAWTEWREQTVRLRQMRNQILKDRIDLSEHGQVFGAE